MSTRTGTWSSGGATPSRSNGAPRALPRCRRPRWCCGSSPRSIEALHGVWKRRFTPKPHGWLRFGLRAGRTLGRRPPQPGQHAVDLVVSPTAVALNPQQGAATPIFKAGDVIVAQVLALLGEGVATRSEERR